MTIEQLEQELRDICWHIGRTDDLDKLCEYFVTATALWARMSRLTPDPQKTA